MAVARARSWAVIRGSLPHRPLTSWTKLDDAMDYRLSHLLEGTMTVAIVTGSSQGIGRAIAERLGEQGASVVVNYHSNQAAAAEVVTEIEAAGGKAVAARADVADPAQLRGLFDLAEERFGGLDILVHNVGIARFAPIAEASDEDFDLIFDTNTRSTFVALREAANRINEGGRIVVISSGVTKTLRAGSGVYAASKAAGEAFAQILAKE